MSTGSELANQGETGVDNWKSKVLITGAVLGAAVGLTAAYLLSQRYEEGEKAHLSVGEGVKIGVLVFSLLRSIASL